MGIWALPGKVLMAIIVICTQVPPGIPGWGLGCLVSHGISGSWFYPDSLVVMESPVSPVSLWLPSELRLHLYGKKVSKKVTAARTQQDGDLAAEILFWVLFCNLNPSDFYLLVFSPVRKKGFFLQRGFPTSLGEQTPTTGTEESRGRKCPALGAWGWAWLVALSSSRKPNSPFDAGEQSVAKELKSLGSSWAIWVG